MGDMYDELQRGGDPQASLPPKVAAPAPGSATPDVKTIGVPPEEGGIGGSIGSARVSQDLNVWQWPESPLAPAKRAEIVPKFADFPRFGGPATFGAAFGPQYGEAQAADMAKIGQAEQGEAQALEGVHAGLENQLRAQQFDLARFQQEHEKRVNESIAQVKDSSDRIANYRVSTDKFWKNPASIIAGIGAIFSGIFSGDPNGATKMLSSYINADLDNQRAELDSYKSGRDAAMNTLGMYRQLWGDKQAADSFAKAKAYDVAAQQVEGLKQRFRSETAIQRADMVVQHLRQQGYQSFANGFAMIYARESLAPSKELANARLAGAMSYGTAGAINGLSNVAKQVPSPTGQATSQQKAIQALGGQAQPKLGTAPGQEPKNDLDSYIRKYGYTGALRFSDNVKDVDPKLAAEIKNVAAQKIQEFKFQADSEGPEGSPKWKKKFAEQVKLNNNEMAKQYDAWMQAGKGKDDLLGYVMWSQMLNHARMIDEATKDDPILRSAFSDISKGTEVGSVLDKIKQRFGSDTPQGKAAVEYYSKLANLLIQDRHQYLGAAQSGAELGKYGVKVSEQDDLPTMIIKLKQGSIAANNQFMAGSANLDPIVKGMLYNHMMGIVNTVLPAYNPGIKKFSQEEQDAKVQKAIEILKERKIPNRSMRFDPSESPLLKQWLN